MYSYRLQCSWQREESTVTVLSPELISGISATVTDYGSSVSYNGVSLDTGRLQGSRLTPVGCIPAMVESWASGYISAYSYEKWGDAPCLMVSYLVGYGSLELEYRTWFSRDDLAPLHGEVLTQGKSVIYLDFER